MSNPNKANRLANETSPYLLQHAHNPVNWYAWSEEAFEIARKENKPVLLSIGYSTCHWCHVMERESFEDNEVAELLNKYFICIKVDREERPDVDSLYMNIAQMLIGRGGWPLNVFLSPEKKLFHAATYIPKYSREFANGKSFGMLDLIPYLGRLWQEQESKILDSATNIMKVFAEEKNQISGSQEIKTEELKQLCEKAFLQLENKFDDKCGGFGSAPKFPSPHVFTFLMNYYKRSNNPKALAMVETTLTKMRLGGIFDQVGYGFHRYSTDREWLLPHFEKMLYDQAMLMMAYAQAYEITKKPIYKQVLDEIFTYISRDMLSEENLFYTAEDADSEGEEGLFYTWTYEELSKALSPEELKKLEQDYGVSKAGNFIEEATRESTGRNILHLQNLKNLHRDILDKLFTIRKSRVYPLKDDKTLVDWNGLMLVGLMHAYTATKDKKYLELSERVFSSIEANFILEDFNLLKSSRLGKISIHHATINDYAFLIWALLELFKATCKENYLILSKTLSDKAIDKFWDNTNNGFYNSDIHKQDLPLNIKDTFDGAIPSANSIMLMNLYYLVNYGYADEFEQYYAKQINFLYDFAKDYSMGFTQFLSFIELSFQPLVLACEIKN